MKQHSFFPGRLSLVWILSVAALLVSASCATNRPADRQVSDAWITTKIKTDLAVDSKAEAHEIDVDTVNGVVKLSGVVDDASERARAARIARETDGVRQVINEIRIGEEYDIGRGVNDAAISANVKTRLAADPEVKALNIDVDTLEGIVTLFGMVNSESERLEAERLARRTDGVKGVRNQLQVRGSTPADELDDID
jgi:hyperosmotically inducible protein